MGAPTVLKIATAMSLAKKYFMQEIVMSNKMLMEEDKVHSEEEKKTTNRSDRKSKGWGGVTGAIGNRQKIVSSLTQQKCFRVPKASNPKS